jgi:ribonuclease HI
VLETDGGEVIAEGAIPLGRATNNYAEYSALIAGLTEALARGIAEVEVLSDSELMCRQLNGEYRVRNAGLLPLYQQVCEMADRFRQVRFTHVRRHLNERADALANQGAALSARGTGRR